MLIKLQTQRTLLESCKHRPRRTEWQQWLMSVLVYICKIEFSKMWQAVRSLRFLSGKKKKKSLLLTKERGRKTRLFQSISYFTLSNRHLLVGAVTPLLLPTGLWDCLKIKEVTRAPQKLFSQAKRQMRTGKSEAKLKGMEGHISHDRSALMRFCADGGAAPWAERRASSMSVMEP